MKRNTPGHLHAVPVFFVVVLLLLTGAVLVFASGCSRGGDSKTEEATSQTSGTDPVYGEADVERIHNGYGTIFVRGRRVEKKADQSTSTVVDWSGRPAAKASKGFRMKEVDGIVYKTGEITDGRDKGNALPLHLNLKYDPKKKDQPVVLFVPGGGFISCEIDDKYAGIHKYIVENGYAVAIMEYHIIGQGRFEDAAEDVQSAIDWLRENGEEYGLDTSGVYLMGNSGGGYVASFAACRAPEDIRCVINFYGLSDIANNKADYEDAAIRAHHRPESSDSQFVYGVESGKALSEDPKGDGLADPATYVDGDEPPFLHFHGTEDLLVSPSQTLHLHEALTKEGIPSVRYVLKGEGHGTKGFRTAESLDLALEFMKKY